MIRCAMFARFLHRAPLTYICFVRQGVITDATATARGKRIGRMLVKRNVSKEAELLPTTCFSSRRPASRGPFLLLSASAAGAVVLLLLLVGRHLLGPETRTPTLTEAINDLSPARNQPPALARDVTGDNRRQEATKAAAGEEATDEASCADNKPECGQWARAGECVRNPHFMRSECCEICTLPTGAEPTVMPADLSQSSRLREIRPAAQPKPPQPLQRSNLPVNAPCADDSTRCAEWSRAGECTANPTFMRSTCRKSCGACSKQPTGTGFGASAA